MISTFYLLLVDWENSKVAFASLIHFMMEDSLLAWPKRKDQRARAVPKETELEHTFDSSNCGFHMLIVYTESSNDSNL